LPQIPVSRFHFPDFEATTPTTTIPVRLPHGSHHDPHIKRKTHWRRTGQRVAIKEHAGPFTELHNRARHAFGPEGKMGSGIERNFINAST